MKTALAFLGLPGSAAYFLRDAALYSGLLGALITVATWAQLVGAS